MMEEFSYSLLAYCWAQSQDMSGRGKEHHKNPAWIFIYLSIYLLIIYHPFATCKALGQVHQSTR